MPTDPSYTKSRNQKQHKIFDKIIADGAVSDSDLRMLIDKIQISEKNGKLDIHIVLNGKFREHILNKDEIETLNLVS